MNTLVIISTSNAYNDGYNNVAIQKLGLITSLTSIAILHGDEYFLLCIMTLEFGRYVLRSYDTCGI